MKKNHYVYKIINLNPTDNQRYYIGVRSCNCVPKNDTLYWSSSNYLKESILQHGIANFKKIILSEWNTRQEALTEEIRLHLFYDVKNNELFYNKANQTSTGFDFDASGIKRHVSKETRKKLSEINKGKIISKETRLKISKANKGKKRTDEARKKISKANKGKFVSKETRMKISKANKGVPKSNDFKEKAKQRSIGHKNNMYGKTHSDKSKQKIGQTSKERNQGAGNGNAKSFLIIDPNGKKYIINGGLQQFAKEMGLSAWTLAEMAKKETQPSKGKLVGWLCFYV